MEPATAQPATRPEACPPAAPDPGPHQPGHPASDLPGTVTATSYASTFGGRAEEAARLRREIAGYLTGCPLTEDIVFIAHEMAANAILHSRSRGASFAVRCQLSPRAARIEVEDMGGPWRLRKPDDRPHGLDIIQALTGPGGWGTHATGTGRLTWARLSW
jgi:hypothetical protein